jgi:hypothetical protein
LAQAIANAEAMDGQMVERLGQSLTLNSPKIPSRTPAGAPATISDTW